MILCCYTIRIAACVLRHFHRLVSPCQSIIQMPSIQIMLEFIKPFFGQAVFFYHHASPHSSPSSDASTPKGSFSDCEWLLESLQMHNCTVMERGRLAFHT